jgi:hypothetical protein
MTGLVPVIHVVQRMDCKVLAGSSPRSGGASGPLGKYSGALRRGWPGQSPAMTDGAVVSHRVPRRRQEQVSQLPTRHCERSEAIQESHHAASGLLRRKRLLAMTGGCLRPIDSVIIGLRQGDAAKRVRRFFFLENQIRATVFPWCSIKTDRPQSARAPRASLRGRKKLENDTSDLDLL